MKQYCRQGFIYLLFPSEPFVVLHDCFHNRRLLMSLTGSIPAVAVTSRVMPSLTLPGVTFFRHFGSLPKRQQPKRRTNEMARKWWGAQHKSGGVHSPGMLYKKELIEIFIITQVRTYNKSCIKTYIKT